MLREPTNYEYTPSMAEDGCIYLGERLRGIIFPTEGGCHKSEVPNAIREMSEYLYETAQEERGMLPHPEEYEDIIPHHSSDEEGDEETPDVTHGITEEGSTMETPEITQREEEEEAGAAGKGF